MVVIYFPGCTYSNNKVAIKKCFTPPAKWDKQQSGWYSNDIQIHATFEGHQLPATLEVDMMDTDRMNKLIELSKSLGAQIIDEKPKEGAYCKFVFNPPAINDQNFRKYQDELWRYKILSKIYWDKVESIILWNRFKKSFAYKWAYIEIRPYLEDDEKLSFWRKER